MSESPPVVSDSFWHHGLYSPWVSPGQTSRVGNLAPLQGIFPTQGSNPRSPARQVNSLLPEPPAGRFFTSRATRKPKNTAVGTLSLLQRVIQEAHLNKMKVIKASQEKKLHIIIFHKPRHQNSYQIESSSIYKDSTFSQVHLIPRNSQFNCSQCNSAAAE